jgi:hypothetical protein
MITIVPLQDLLGLEQGLHEFPLAPQGNWEWRFGEAELTNERRMDEAERPDGLLRCRWSVMRNVWAL